MTLGSPRSQRYPVPCLRSERCTLLRITTIDRTAPADTGTGPQCLTPKTVSASVKSKCPLSLYKRRKLHFPLDLNSKDQRNVNTVATSKLSPKRKDLE